MGRPRARTAITDRAAVRCRGLGKTYGTLRGLGAFAAAFRDTTGRGIGTPALLDVDLEVAPGEALGIIGPNGAGKSTLLKLIAGISRPTSGSLTIHGSVRSVIELGAGFHPELTGTENVRCLGVVHGLSAKAIEASLPRIEAFADIGEAIGRPLKHYSLGMISRLAFAVVTDQRPDVLAIDEVLAVGDQAFQARCLDRIQGMVAAGTTLVFVSHEMSLVAAVCERVVQLREGRIVDDGVPTEVIERYLRRSASTFVRVASPATRLGDAGFEIGAPTADSLRVWADVEVGEPLRRPLVGFEVVLPMIDPDNVVSSSTHALGPFERPGRYRVTGATDHLWGVGRNMRFNLSIIDAEHQELLDAATLDVPVVGELEGRRLGPLGVALTIPVTWTMRPVAATTNGERPRAEVAVDDAVVSVRDLSKWYRTRARTRGAALRPSLPGSAGRLRHHDITALDGVSLDIGRGESVGLIGPNGSGKTTLLRLIEGVTRPDRGTVSTRGTVVALLELTAGFHPDLSGLENLRVLGRLLGLGRDELDDHVERAVEFAGLGAVIHDPEKTYSSGMTARLGLSMALVVPADLLLLDEVLAVGDAEFRRRAIERLRSRCAEGAAIVFVSHDLQMVAQLCDRVVRLEHGRCIEDGPADTVIGAYAGRSWAGGVHDAEGGVRIHRLAVRSRHVPTGGTLLVEGSLDVDEAVPSARLEVALRSPPADRDQALTIDERAALSAMMTTVVPPGEDLVRPGAHRFECALDTGRLVGVVDVVVSVIDGDRRVVLAEVWEQVVVGTPDPGSRLTFDPALSWSVESLGLDPRTGRADRPDSDR